MVYIVTSCHTLPCASHLGKSLQQRCSRPFNVKHRPTQTRLRCRCLRSVAMAASQETSAQEQGQISSELIEQMKASIKSSLQADKVVVDDIYGDGRHVSIEVVSKLFEGQSSVKRQRLVYKAIWQELQETVHAVDSMKTSTPDETGLAS